MNNTYTEDVSWSKKFIEECRFWIPNLFVPVIFVVGLIGNVMTIIVLTRKRMTGATNSYLTALAVSDLLFLIFYFTISLEHHLKSSDYIWYWHYWRYAIWFHDATNGVSIWVTVSFTLERYIAVCHPFKGKVVQTESRARRVILLVVAFCVLSTASTPFEWYVAIEPFSSSFIHYSSLGKNTTYTTFFYWFSSITFVFIPLILVGSLNFLLINAVWKSQRRRGHLTVVTPKKCLNKERQENKVTIALVGVVFLFLVCQTPGAVTVVIKVFYLPQDGSPGDNILRGIGNICNLLVALNAACNFLLYCAMSDKYRQTLLKTFCPRYYTRHHRASTFSSNASISFRQSKR